MAGLLERIAHAEVQYLVLAFAVAAFGFWQGLRSLLRARLIEDVPTARIRSAPQGYVELVGEALVLDGEPIIAPLSRVHCCWYSYRVEERSGKNWRTRESGVSDGIFLLRDATGDCVVDPEGAEVTTVHRKTWYASGWGDSMPGPYLRFGLDGKRKGGGGLLGRVFENLHFGAGEYRFQESVLLGHDPLYAIGLFKSLGAADASVGRREISKAILRAWKSNQETLLQRFDHNRDGRIDMEEWEDARRVAARQADREFRETAPAGPVHTLSRPPGGRYMLSNLPEFDLVGRHGLRKWLGFTAFLLAGSAAALMIVTRLSGA